MRVNVIAGGLQELVGPHDEDNQLMVRYWITKMGCRILLIVLPGIVDPP